ncbi:hypothetical protein ACS0TY_020240 [Phlomoides rotata]
MKSANISRLCDRNFGIEADGEIFALPGINGTDYTMRIFNYDGSEPEMCGNGCFARFIAELENLQGKQSFTVQTGARLIIPEIREDGKMIWAKPNLKAPDDPTKLTPNKDQAAVKAKLDVNGVLIFSVANCVTQDLQEDELDLVGIGPKFEHHAMFPARTKTRMEQIFCQNY